MKTRIAKLSVVPLGIALALLMSALVSCGKKGASGKPADVDYYTCTMHPSVKSQDPKAKCPICSMDLVPVMKRGSAGASGASKASEAHGQHASDAPRSDASHSNSPDAPTEFTVPIERQQQIGVTYGVIEKRPLTLMVRAVGTVAYDKQRHWDYVSRVEGYVKTLSVFSRGELVEKNAPILTIYSPDLLTTQNEFIDVLK